MIFPIILTIQEKLEVFLTNPANRACGITFARALFKSMKARFAYLSASGPNSNDFLLATLVDPRYKRVMFDSSLVNRGKTLLQQEASFYHAEDMNTNEATDPAPSTSQESGISLWSVLEARSKKAREELKSESPFLSTLEATSKEVRN